MAEAASDSDGMAEAVLTLNRRFITEMNKYSGPHGNGGEVTWRGRYGRLRWAIHHGSNRNRLQRRKLRRQGRFRVQVMVIFLSWIGNVIAFGLFVFYLVLIHHT